MSCIVFFGIVVLASAMMIVVGAVYQPEHGVGSVLLSDGLALLWITAASTAHLALVPAICVFIALRDQRRNRAGIPIPEPRSVWIGHESVFAASDSAKG